ncbi:MULTISPECIES: sigma-70 family RNA polymerase sigma factor [unclassified Streptomyces]|uniref:sigma-70 family RNA polymerase sigma factor n=1 Tax=unclassified Streptomyces TaxID=2593676 RepID=UPI0037F6A8B4
MTTNTPATTTLLTDAQRGAVAPLVYGGTNKSIGAQLHLSPEGVASHLRTARTALGRRGCSRPVLIHALLTAREVQPPAITGPMPEFTARDRQIIRAVAEHSLNAAIGDALGVRADDVRAEIDAVAAKAGADNEVHLVGLGHAWGILGESAPPGALSRPALASSTAEVA